jgi:hypothetical protein
MNLPEPGDEVSFLNSKLKAIVKEVRSKDDLIVTLEEGFDIPVKLSEIFVTKRSNTQNPKPAPETKAVPFKKYEQGRFLAFSMVKDTKDNTLIKVSLVNTSDEPILYTAFVADGPGFKGISKGEIGSAQACKLASFPLSDSENWKAWHINILPFSVKSGKDPSPQWAQIKFKEANLIKSVQPIPFSEDKGWLISLDSLIKREESQSIAASTETKATSALIKRNIEQVNDIVDLHIEEIEGYKTGMTGGEALNLQIHHFKNSLEKAYAFKLPKIIFIHGVGTGILKNNIHNYLRDVEYISGYKDAEFTKFGTGATEVTFKRYID